MINQFAIFKVGEKKSDKQPDYRLSAKVGEEYVEIGAGWIKEGKGGSKFISCQLSKPYKDKKGYGLEEVKSDTPPTGNDIF